MGGGALAAVSLSISDVRVEFGQADFPLDVIKRHADTSSNPHFGLGADIAVFGKRLLLVGCDDHVALGLAVVAHALHGVDLGQLVDDLPVLSVHGRETVASLWLLSLQTPATHVHERLKH